MTVTITAAPPGGGTATVRVGAQPVPVTEGSPVAWTADITLWPAKASFVLLLGTPDASGTTVTVTMPSSATAEPLLLFVVFDDPADSLLVDFDLGGGSTIPVAPLPVGDRAFELHPVIVASVQVWLPAEWVTVLVGDTRYRLASSPITAAGVTLTPPAGFSAGEVQAFADEVATMLATLGDTVDTRLVAGAAQTLDVAVDDVFDLYLTADLTLTYGPVTTPRFVLLRFVGDIVDRTVTFPGGGSLVVPAGSTAFAVTSETIDDGTTWQHRLVGEPTLVDPAGAVTSVDGQTGVVVTGAALKAANLSDLADAPTARTNLGLGTAATQATGAFDPAGSAAAAQAAAIAASQPVDSDLTAIAALTTTAFGRALLALADAVAGRTALGLGTAATAATGDFDAAGAAAAAQAASQPVDSDLTALAALTSTAYGRSVLEAANAAALRTLAGTVIGTDVQAQDAELAAIAGLTSAADKAPYFTGSGAAALADLTAAGRAILDDANAAAQLTTLGVSAFAQTVLDDADAATARVTLGVLNGLPRPKRTGLYYSDHLAITSRAVAVNRLYAAPFLVTASTAFDRIACVSTVVGTAGSVMRLGIYADDGTGRPGALVVDGSSGGTLDTATGTGKKEHTISQTLAAGIYWLAAVAQVAAPTVRTWDLSVLNPGWIGVTLTASELHNTGWYQSSITGALPSPWGASYSEANGTSLSPVAVYLRAT